MPKTPDIPRLTDPCEAEDHFRLVIHPDHLGMTTALVICCDDQGRPGTHVQVLDCDASASPSECAEVLDTLLERLGAVVQPSEAGLCLALTRPGGAQVQDYDKAWFRAFHRVCHRRGVIPVGVYVVSRAGIRAVHVDDAA